MNPCPRLVSTITMGDSNDGSWLIAREDREPPDLHAFYGFAALAAVGIIYSYRAQMRDQVLLLYGGGGLFLMGLAIRTMII